MATDEPQTTTDVKDWGAPGQIDRSKIADELKEKPWLHERLNMMVRGEVGPNASPEVRRIQMETAMNRAIDRGHSLEQALWDTGNHGNAGYYPRQTFSRGGFDRDTYASDLKAVLGGSNYGGKYLPPGKMVTGNASDDVARHQFQRGTPGFTLPTGSGPESYFSEGSGRKRTADLPATEDMTEHYNTQLDASEIPQFKQWVRGQSAITGRDVMKDRFDYDIQGLWKSNHGASLEFGVSDRFKKPNHPTFSTDSVHSHPGGFTGGEWYVREGKWEFAPSQHNLMFNSWDAMHDHFDSGAEGKSVLVGKTPAYTTQSALAELGAHFTMGDIGPASKNIEDRSRQPRMSQEEMTKAMKGTKGGSPLPAERGLLARELGVEDIQDRRRARRR